MDYIRKPAIKQGAQRQQVGAEIPKPRGEANQGEERQQKEEEEEVAMVRVNLPTKTKRGLERQLSKQEIKVEGEAEEKCEIRAVPRSKDK